MPEKVVAKLLETYDKTRAKYENHFKDKLIQIEQYPENIDGETAMKTYKENDRLFREFLGMTAKSK